MSRISELADRLAGRPRGAKAIRRREREAMRGAKEEGREEEIGWVSVRSSWIDAVRYNPETRTLDVRHKNGNVYPDYPNCSPQMWASLFQARSIGRWVWKHYPPQAQAGGKRSAVGRGAKAKTVRGRR